MPGNAIAVSSTIRRQVRQFYDALFKAFGPQHWWPGESPVEIIVGAILTQNTNWKNVEKAIHRLRAARMLDWAALRRVRTARLAELIRPSGYFNVKARRLKAFTAWLWKHHSGHLDRLRSLPTPRLREELLSIHGIGPETADSILLYALGRTSFVVDAYTRRITIRHGWVNADCDYHELQELFEANLPVKEKLFNEYHALIVAVGKRHCGPRARCEGCPLESFPHDADAMIQKGRRRGLPPPGP